MSWVSHADVSSCISCHYDGPNVGQILGGQGSKLTAFSRRQELEFWLSNDKHTIARRRVEPFAESRTESELNALLVKLEVLAQSIAEQLQQSGITIDKSQLGLTEFPKEWIGESNFLSRRICDKLWGSDAVDTADGYAKFRDNCLTCHGGYQPGESGFDLADTGDAQLGISCLYCHQIGDNEAWVAAHSAPEAGTELASAGAQPEGSGGNAALGGHIEPGRLVFRLSRRQSLEEYVRLPRDVCRRSSTDPVDRAADVLP